jgi:superfamily I DNA/RNA helicase
MNGTWWVGEDDLKDEQKRAVDSISIDKSYLIVGSPGSGKTNVLLLRSKYLRSKKVNRIRFVTFTSTLRDFVKYGGAQYKINPEEVVTSAHLFLELLADNDEMIPKIDGETFVKNRNRLAEAVLSLLDRSPELEDSFDALLIDEIQDYTVGEIKAMSRLSAVIIGAGDENQRIYQEIGGMAEFARLAAHKVKLPRHFRNGKKICMVADAIFAGSANSPNTYAMANYDESKMPSSVTKEICINFSRQVEKIIEAIQLQLRAYPGELIGILFPTNDEVNDFCLKARSTAELAKVLYRVKGEDDVWSGETRVIVSTIHSAKGLEFRAVHIGGCESLSRTGKKNQKRLAFTAVTRAKTSLCFYWSGSVPPYLTDAIQRADDEVKDVAFGSLFS